MIEFKPVYKGCSGECVLILQSLLRSAGFLGANGKPLDIDGICGTNTEYAILSFQSNQGAYGIDCGTYGECSDKMWKRLLGV